VTVTVREYGYLTKAGSPNGLDHQVLAPKVFDALKALILAQPRRSEIFWLAGLAGHEAIQVGSYVGVFPLPGGGQLEIVPKITASVSAAGEGRRVLLKMLSTVLDLNFRETDLAELDTLRRPWVEALIGHVLKAITTVVRAGLRKKYRREPSLEPFLKGQLNIVRQIREPIWKQQHFHVTYDDYSTNRAENRLLRSTLDQLAKWTTSPAHQQMCRELQFVMADVPPSHDVAGDLRSWSPARDMVRYKQLLPWIRLVLAKRAPVFAGGDADGISLLFSMEQLFERYVARKLGPGFSGPLRLKEQARSEHLVEHKQEDWFRLEPDLLVLCDDSPVSVLDTKWKLIDSAMADASGKYNLSQADFYQLFAYGQKYQEGRGDMFLIYPYHDGFREALPVFAFSGELRLWAVPFDLKADAMVWPVGLRLPWVQRSTLNEMRL
jgi:5-methylcytosine-specific restriction enzyme subunit McrC